MTLPSITDFFEHPDPDCRFCHGLGHVCEDHPGRPWGGVCCAGDYLSIDDLCEHGACHCGAAGMPCPRVPA